MASLPGMPGSRGLPSATDPGSGGSDSSFDVPAGFDFPSPPIVINQTVFSTQVGSIAPTTAGNTLVVLVTQRFVTVPYINSSGVQIGVDWEGFPVFDGISFNDAALGPRNSADGSGALMGVPVSASGYVGWEELTGIYYLQSVPGGITSIRFNLVAPIGDLSPFIDFPFFAFVYELSPSVLDAASDNMIEIDTSGLGPFASTLATGSVTTTAPGIAFALVGKRELVGGLVGGGGMEASWPTDSLVTWLGAFGTNLYTILACRLDGVSGTATLFCGTTATNIGTSKSNFLYGGAIAAFKTLIGVSGGGGGGGTPGADLNQFLPNVWINS